MSRRDTILIAVLINVGLLVILFATAITSDEVEPLYVTSIDPMPVETPIAAVPEPAPTTYVIKDEVDEVLSQYTEEPEPAPLVIATPEAPKADMVEITVKRGDSLDKIARGNGSTIDAIMEANNLAKTTLQIGQVLQVPLTKKIPGIKKRISADTAKASEDFYTIRSGDNPWVIAMKYRIPLDELLALNGLNEDSARKLKPGDRIRVK